MKLLEQNNFAYFLYYVKLLYRNNRALEVVFSLYLLLNYLSLPVTRDNTRPLMICRFRHRGMEMKTVPLIYARAMK